MAREGCPSVSEKDIDAVIKGQHRAYREADFGLAIKAWEAFRKGRSGKKLSDEELDLVKLYVELMKAERERGPRVSLALFQNYSASFFWSVASDATGGGSDLSFAK